MTTSRVRIVGAIVLALHAAAHLAIYPESGAPVPSGVSESSPFWVPPALERDALGMAGRTLLVVSAALFFVAAVGLVRRGAGRWWIVPALGGAVASIAATAVVGARLEPSPDALWVGPVISALVFVVAVVEWRRGIATPRPRDDVGEIA